jgi:hypothetical protein
MDTYRERRVREKRSMEEYRRYRRRDRKGLEGERWG